MTSLSSLQSPFLHRRSTRQQHDLPIDPLAFLTRQKRHHLAHIFRLAGSPQRRHTGDTFTRDLDAHVGCAARGIMPTVCGEHIRHDTPRCDGIDGDSLGPSIRGERAGEAFDGSFGASVQGVVFHTGHGGRDGGGEDDATAMSQMFETVLSDEILGATVQIEDFVEVVFGDGFLVDEGFDAGVGDDDVEATEVRESLGEERGDLRGFGDVGFDGDGAGVKFGCEGLDELVGGGGGFAVVDGDGGAAGSELEGDACAETSSTTCDEGDFTFEGLVGWR